MTTTVSAMLGVPKREIPAELRNNICAYRLWRTEEDRRREGEKKKAEDGGYSLTNDEFEMNWIEKRKYFFTE